MFATLAKYVNNPRNEKIILLGISVIVFILQIITLRPQVGIGEPYYIAEHITEGYGYTLTMPFSEFPTVSCFIPPLYVWFHLVLMKLGFTVAASGIAGLVFFHFANYFLYRLFKDILGARIALGGFILFAFYLPLWIIAQKADPDGLNALLVAATVYFIYRISKDAPKKYYIYLGVIFGIQLLVRPDILMGIVIFGVWLIWPKVGRLEKLKWYLVSVAIALLIVSPWTIRNYLTFGSFVLVSANSGYNFYMGNNLNATGEMYQSIETDEGRSELDSIKNYFQTHPSDVERDSYLFSLGKKWVLSHPLDAVAISMKKFYMHWWHRSTAGSEVESQPWMIIGYRIASIYLLLFGAIGFFWVKRERVRSLLLSLFLYSTLISVIFFVQSRHRALKVDPSLIYLSVTGVVVTVGKVFYTKESVSI